MAKRSFPVPNFYIEDQSPASTPMEALMRAGTDDPEVSTIEQEHPLDAAIAEAMSELTETERIIAVGSFVEGLSRAQIGQLVGLSKLEVHRRLPGVRSKLAAALSEHPEILQYLGGK